jgi:hypothetical protein
MWTVSKRSSPEIEVTADGFAVLQRGEEAAIVCWSSVKEIFAFKLDLWVHDTIRIGFRVSDDGTYYDVDEDWPGYRALVEELERRFEIGDDWWPKVAFPAFATNRTTLWGEPGE